MDREHKGRSIIAFPDDYVVIDTETTGLDYNHCHLIEVAAVRYHEGEQVASFSSLIQPPMCEVLRCIDDTQDLWESECYYVDAFITSLTGITNEMLEEAPTEDIVIPEFMKFIGDAVLVGHNVNFDINFLYDAASACGFVLGNDFVDTLRISHKALPGLPHYRLSDIAAACSAPEQKAHRATTDCLTTAFCLQSMKASVLSKMTEAEFERLFHPKYTKELEAITRTVDEIDTTNPLYGKSVVFTGTLEKMGRKEALQIVANLGGIPSNSLTQQTNILVIGNGEFVASVKNGKTGKMKKAEAIRQKGGDIEIMSEDVFFDMVSDWI